MERQAGTHPVKSSRAGPCCLDTRCSTLWPALTRGHSPPQGPPDLITGQCQVIRLPRTLPKIFPTCSPASPVLLLREPSPPHPAGESDGTSLGNSETLKGGKLGFTLIRCAVFKGYSVVVYGGGVEVANTEEQCPDLDVMYPPNTHAGELSQWSSPTPQNTHSAEEKAQATHLAKSTRDTR